MAALPVIPVPVPGGGDRTGTIVSSVMLGAVIFIVARGDLSKWAAIWNGSAPAAPTPTGPVTMAIPGTAVQGTPGAPAPSGSNPATPVLPGTIASGSGVASGFDWLFGSTPAY